MFGANPFGWPYCGQSYAGLASAPAATSVINPGGGIIIPRRRYVIPREQLETLEQDEAIVLSLLLRTRKRLR